MNQIDLKTTALLSTGMARPEADPSQLSAELPSVLEAEFGAAWEGLDDSLSRRRWLQLMGASLALGAASTGCRYQEEKIAPYAFRPQNRIPGIPVKYATSLNFAGAAQPLEATSYDGRPIKLDGNRLHPDSLGASDAWTQARILELYDPERLRSPMRRQGDHWAEASSADFWQAWRELLNDNLSSVAILSEPLVSPSLNRLKSQFEARGGQWFTFTSIADDNARAGMRLALGQVGRPQYHLDKAKVVVSLEADPLKFDPAAVRNHRKFIEGRAVDQGQMSRWYVVEAANSLTGCNADHRLSLPSSQIASFLGSLAAEVSRRQPGDAVNKNLPYRQKLLQAMAQDLRDHAGQGLVLVGESQPPSVHAAALRLNAELNNLGTTLTLTPVLDSDRPGTHESLRQLQAAVRSGEVKTLLMLGGNPVFDAPADLAFAETLAAVGRKIHASCQRNETSLLCDWVYPLAHPLEVWGDGLAADGSHCLAQPLIAPLFGGQSELEVLANVLGSPTADGLAIVQETARPLLSGDFETAWNRAVHDGFIAGSQPQPLEIQLGSVEFPSADEAWTRSWDGGPLEVIFTPSAGIYDGRFANNAWLQELPDFVTKLTWENAALVSPETAEKLGLKQDTLVDFSIGGQTIRLPVHVQPGQARGTMAVAFGYGRTAAGRVGGDQAAGVPSAGTAVHSFRSTDHWHWVNGATVTARGPFYRLACTQEKWTIDATGRDEIQRRMLIDPEHGIRSRMIREGSFESYSEFLKKHPSADAHGTPIQEHGSRAKPESGVAQFGAVSAPPAAASIAFLPVLNSSLPVLNPAVGSAAPLEDPSHSQAADHSPQWPENFHMHHELFDLTPGVREQYKQTDPTLKNVWGMSIDLSKCSGCNACVIACQAENNIPVVGREQILRHRQMHWMRIDSYFGGNLYNREAAASDDRMMVHQPVTCQHCENAPCETVCPVAATTHSTEGLNDMVYNRCIGTRYCGNNCPYKVRRFNYFNYTDAATFLKYPNADQLSPGARAVQNMMMNPEVTIRSRGVMEKCTYCVQRIQNTKIAAKNQQREIGANEITSACQDVCPTQAIKFGDLNHPQSEVRAAHHNPRAYVLLEELNNYPRTRYLSRVRNPHPALVDWDDRHGLNHAVESPAAEKSA